MSLYVLVFFSFLCPCFHAYTYFLLPFQESETDEEAEEAAKEAIKKKLILGVRKAAKVELPKATESDHPGKSSKSFVRNLAVYAGWRIVHPTKSLRFRDVVQGEDIDKIIDAVKEMKLDEKTYGSASHIVHKQDAIGPWISGIKTKWNKGTWRHSIRKKRGKGVLDGLYCEYASILSDDFGLRSSNEGE